MLLHSSGTTSLPKGIMHSANTLRYATEHVIRRWELTAEDRHLVVCEFGFVGSLVFGYLAALLSGATAVLLPRWNAEDALHLIEAHRCTYALFMPTHGADVLQAGQRSARDWSSLRVLAAPGLSRSAGSRCTRFSACRRWPTTGSPRYPGTPPTAVRSHGRR